MNERDNFFSFLPHLECQAVAWHVPNYGLALHNSGQNKKRFCPSYDSNRLTPVDVVGG